MTGIERALWEFEAVFWLFAIFIGAGFALMYLTKIISDIRQDRRIKKLMKKWEKESPNSPDNHV